ncbi:MAG TPA: hypothetical protein VMU93_13665 [Caulobacteraceae bacterium]|nr:hypothetical protein [Caulobacteraceae bacterium]
MFLLAAGQGVLFTDMTTRIGALQTVPAVLLGTALWRLHGELRLPPSAGALIGALALAWIVAASAWRLSDLAIWPAFGPLVLGLAAAAASKRLSRAARGFAALGRLAIAMQLVYLPVDIVYFRAAHLLLGEPRGWVAWLALLGVFPVILLAAAAAHRFVQRPLAAWADRRLGPGAPLLQPD